MLQRIWSVRMKVLDLFSGIGGFSLGLERAGMETVAFCECAAYTRKILNKNWPGIPVYEDVKTLTYERLKNDGIQTVDLVSGGYPCQPFSSAGKRKGQGDDRHLWPEMHRIIDDVRPTWVLCENVVGHITLGIDQVLSDLESSGYSCQTFGVPAVAVDANHLRMRVWIVAYSNGIGCNIRGEATGRKTGGALRDLQGPNPTRLFPTPKASDATHGASTKEGAKRAFTRGHGISLPQHTRLFPTPAARDYRSPNSKPYAERGGGKKGEQLPNFVGGQLNPNWVEWLMGYPIGWTALKP